MLEYIVTSKTKRNLLKLFLTNPETAFYTREIARLTSESVNAVKTQLDYLENSGLLKSYRQGNLKYFKVDKDFPFFTELKKIIYSTVGLGDYLKKRLKDSKRIESAFIYGSVAKNQERVNSDIDLFIVGDINEKELHRIISNIERDIGREINYTLMTKEEVIKRKESGEPFIKRIEREEKLILKGDLDVY